MTAKENYFNVRVSSELKSAIDSAMDTLSVKSRPDFLSKMISLMPLYCAMNEKGIDMDTAIERINADTVKTEIRVIKKGINDIEFEKWKEKLFHYNENANQDDRVFITQNLFLEIIKGNVTKLSQLYRENESEIKAHNEKMKTQLSDNRKFVNRVKKEGYKNLAEWIKARTA